MGSNTLPTSSRDRIRGRLLDEIAEALQVPLAAFSKRPDTARDPAPSAVGAAVPNARDTERAELLNAFDRIPDPDRRRRLLLLAQGLAEASERGL
jgi:hypothetical protein